MNNNKKHVLILGGSSDIGVEVVNFFLRHNWKVTAHYFKNKRKLAILKKYSNNLHLINFNFVSHNNFFTEKLIAKKFGRKYDAIISLVGYVDNKGFKNTNLDSILKSLIANTILPVLIEKMSSIVN